MVKRYNNCGGYIYNNTLIQWARNEKEYSENYKELNSYGLKPELRVAHGLKGRWDVVREFIKETNAQSLLDLGGFGNYKDNVKKHKCINIHHHQNCDLYAGKLLPYKNGSFEFVVIETVLHHAAENTISVLKESVRVSNNFVMIAEDVIDRRASNDVFESYRKHDPGAIYRASSEWVALALVMGLKLYKLVYLHRVPIHILRETTKCNLPRCYIFYLKKSFEATFYIMLNFKIKSKIISINGRSTCIL